MATQSAADIARDMKAKFETMISERAEADKAELRADFDKRLNEAVEAGVTQALASRKYRPESDADPDSDRALAGTVYGRLGVKLHQVELIHDLLDAARVADPRLSGPNEKTRNIVEAARKARAMDTAESGFGAQLVADAMYVPKIWQAARENYGIISGLIETRAMTGPVEKHPIVGNVPDMIWVSESTAAISGLSEYGTQKVASQEITLTANKFLAHYNYSGEMVEDSVVPFVTVLEDAFALTQARTADKLFVNGDTTNAGTGNINEDDADPANTNYYLAADGARHAALVDNTANASDASGALTWAKIVGLRGLMIDRDRDADWGNVAQDVFYVTNPELVDDILNLSELKTVANAGASVATVLAGEVARIGQSPLIASIAMPLTEADGKASTTAGNNTKGSVLCFNRRGYLWGVRRAAQVEVERRAGTDQWRLVLSMRLALGRYTPTGAASGIEHTALLYNC